MNFQKLSNYYHQGLEGFQGSLVSFKEGTSQKLRTLSTSCQKGFSSLQEGFDTLKKSASKHPFKTAAIVVATTSSIALAVIYRNSLVNSLPFNWFNIPNATNTRTEITEEPCPNTPPSLPSPSPSSSVLPTPSPSSSAAKPSSTPPFSEKIPQALRQPFRGNGLDKKKDPPSLEATAYSSAAILVTALVSLRMYLACKPRK